MNIVGPTLAGIPSTAAARIRAGDYHGQAKDAAGYIRESIVNPNAHVLQGPTYSAGGRSFMPPDYGETLKARADRPDRGVLAHLEVRGLSP